MPRRADTNDVIAAVRSVAARHPDRTVWIGIDGFGAAGKSTLATSIASAVDRVTIVHVDDLWGPSITEWDWDRFGAEVLQPLLSGQVARYRCWDWAADLPGEWASIEPGRVVVVEGVSSTRAEAGAPWDLTVWVEAPREVRLARALARDGAERMPRWLADWMPSEEAYAARERPHERVDLLVDGTA